MRFRLITILTPLLAALASADADAGFEAQAAAWNYDVHGQAADPGGQVDFDQYQVAGSTQPDLTLRYRIDEPSWWPDVSLGYSRIVAGGTHVVTQPTGIGDVSLPLGATETTHAKVNDLSLEARYAVIDAPVNLTLGLALRYLDGTILISNSDNGEQDPEKIRQAFPLLTTSIRWPLTRWLALDVDGAWIQAGHDGAYQWQAGVEFSDFHGLSLQLGWMVKHYNVLSDDYRFDARLDGVRAGLIWRL